MSTVFLSKTVSKLKKQPHKWTETGCSIAEMIQKMLLQMSQSLRRKILQRNLLGTSLQDFVLALPAELSLSLDVFLEQKWFLCCQSCLKALVFASLCVQMHSSHPPGDNSQFCSARNMILEFTSPENSPCTCWTLAHLASFFTSHLEVLHDPEQLFIQVHCSQQQFLSTWSNSDVYLMTAHFSLEVFITNTHSSPSLQQKVC